MVDNTKPISNFHAYQPVDAVPHAEAPERGLAGALENVGVDPAKFRNFRERVRSMDANDWLTQLRTFATSRPAIVISGIALAIIGARLIRRRML